MRFLIFPVVFIAGALASVPVRDACSEDAVILANIQESDPIQIRHGVVGETIPCYAVSVTQAGTEVRGFILGTSLPSIQEFDRKRAQESRMPIPTPPAPVPEEKKPAVSHTAGPPFEAWSGVDTNGKRMHIAPGDARVTLVTFWAAQSRAARRLAQNLMTTESEFKPKGLRSFGLVEAVNVGRAKYYLDDMGLDYPQALDGQKLAAKYNADPMKGTTLVIDASNHIVAISSNPAEIRAAVASLLAP
jgi:hypothetical protein